MTAANARATAETLLRTLGGRTVLLRMPQPAIPEDAAEQTGLATPLFRDLPLQPVVFRRGFPTTAKANAKAATDQATAYELLVPASAVLRLVGTLAFGSAEALFTDTAGVLVEGTLLRVTGVSSAQTAGEVYLYRVSLTGPERLR